MRYFPKLALTNSISVYRVSVSTVMARDVLRTPSEHYRNLSQLSAEEIAEFISTLSSKLQEIISDDVTSTEVINAHKSQ